MEANVINHLIHLKYFRAHISVCRKIMLPQYEFRDWCKRESCNKNVTFYYCFIVLLESERHLELVTKVRINQQRTYSCFVCRLASCNHLLAVHHETLEMVEHWCQHHLSSKVYAKHSSNKSRISEPFLARYELGIVFLRREHRRLSCFFYVHQ